jgi:hypothetical protein
MREAVGFDLDRVWSLEAEEQRRFVVEHPRSAALRERARSSMPEGVPSPWVADLNFPHPPVWVTDAHGARFRDVDGHEYIDFLLGICLAFCGHAPAPVVEAVARRAARLDGPAADRGHRVGGRGAVATVRAAAVAVRPILQPVDPGLYPLGPRRHGAPTDREVRRELSRAPRSRWWWRREEVQPPSTRAPILRCSRQQK